MAVKRKKVIFIGGTSYSGSTFLDMMLANDPVGFSCGEVRALFHPTRSYHIDPLCGCGSRNCDLWKNVLSSGAKNVFSTIFDIFPNVEFIVDSSKEPYWISSQAKNPLLKGIECKHLLIWKTPLEFAHSCKKRGETNWQKKWVNYHRMYLRVAQNWKSVRYYDLTNKPDTLKKICDFLEIPYFLVKANYWDKKHHTLFGNQSAKFHLKPKKSRQYKVFKEYLNYDSDRKGFSTDDLHRTIYYKNVNDKALEKSIREQIASNSWLRDILELLNDRDILNNGDDAQINWQLRSSLLYFHLQKGKRLATQKLMKYKR